MNSTVLKEIMAFLFGRKYYANIVATKGTTKQEICSYIFATKEAANRHRLEIETTLSFRFVETVSFRSIQSRYPNACFSISKVRRKRAMQPKCLFSELPDKILSASPSIQISDNRLNYAIFNIMTSISA